MHEGERGGYQEEWSEWKYHLAWLPSQKMWERPLWQQPKAKISKSQRNMNIFLGKRKR